MTPQRSLLTSPVCDAKLPFAITVALLILTVPLTWTKKGQGFLPEQPNLVPGKSPRTQPCKGDCQSTLLQQDLL